MRGLSVSGEPQLFEDYPPIEGEVFLLENSGILT